MSQTCITFLTCTYAVASGLERFREASNIAEQGLKLDPFNLDLKKVSEEATQGILKDLLTGDLSYTSCTVYVM